ncbi:hypothetical protein B0H13DRAFT_2377145 [Mycena leptocephala]|nr:hypothetical protein B0H13DRAFT_2377145 [Mycena leptocephala]
MPLLRHLDLILFVRSVFMLHEAPLLRTVVLNWTAALDVSLPWGQLTCLTLRNAFPSDCVRILQQTTNLVYCEIGVRFESNQPKPDIDSSLPSLESLTIRVDSSLSAYGDQISAYIDRFMFPALRCLKISERLLSSEDPVRWLTSFISKSGCKLQEIHITGERFVPEDMYPKAFPSIPKLSFNGVYLGEIIAHDSDEED